MFISYYRYVHFIEMSITNVVKKPFVPLTYDNNKNETLLYDRVACVRLIFSTESKKEYKTHFISNGPLTAKKGTKHILLIAQLLIALIMPSML